MCEEGESYIMVEIEMIDGRWRMNTTYVLTTHTEQFDYNVFMCVCVCFGIDCPLYDRRSG